MKNSSQLLYFLEELYIFQRINGEMSIDTPNNDINFFQD